MDGDTQWAGSRQLLKQIRSVMAGGGEAQSRLDKIVEVIARDMVAEVCSIYVKRAGDVLELFATHGLMKEAVHGTRLRVGEGLVGDIAAYSRALALPDASKHPLFAYRPETGEERYSSFLGVPVMRGGRVLGVLVVQNQIKREYSEEETEALETVAMVVAELLASGEVIERAEQVTSDGIALKPLRLESVELSGGLAIGQAVLHRQHAPVGEMVAQDPEAELVRLTEAVSAMHDALDAMLDDVGQRGAGEHIEVLQTYRQIAEDRGWIRRIRQAVESGLTAEAAVMKVQSDTRARMAHVQDAYLRERLLDLEDLANRLIQHLMEEVDGDGNAVPDLPEDAVLVARGLGPAELLDYDTDKLRAVVLEEGSANAHVAIVARALDIPMVGNMRGVLTQVDPLDELVVDGDNATVFVRPTAEFRHVFANSMAELKQRKEEYRRQRDLPAMTRDGVEVALHMNANLLIDLPQLDETGAAGIGLYRTEVPFMVRSAFPDVDAQTRLYARILDAAAGRPVVFRTLDVGGDKLLPYFNEAGDEENPAMGWRALRVALDRPVVLREQLRAMVRAAAGRRLRVMFPMVAEVAELDAARRVLEVEVERAGGRGETLPEALEVGVMLEVPSLIFQLDKLLPRADFISVGSNDLMQFLYAADRGNARLDGRYDPLSAPMLSVLRDMVRRCDDAGVPLSLCGEMAGQPLDAMALIGLGFRSLSMSPGAIGPVRMMTRSLNAADLGKYLESLLESTDHSFRVRLRWFAKDHGVDL